MNEIQWLVKILTKHKLSNEVKDLFIERIGEVEAKISSPGVHHQMTIPVPILNNKPISQAQLRDMAEVQSEEAPEISPIAPQLPISPLLGSKEIVTARGNGTSIRGPSKFRRG